MDTAIKRKESKSHYPIAIYMLMISAFAIGTTEFVIMGLLPQVASDLEVSIRQAGLLVSGYALGVAFGGPILTVMTVRLPRKGLLLALMALFVAANIMSAIANEYYVLMIARILSAFTHGTVFGIGSIVAARLVSPEKRASAIAMMFIGVTLANIMGVPMGTLIGQSYGWRTAFWVVAVLGIFSMITLAIFVPRLQNQETPSFMKEISVLRNPEVLRTLLMTVLGFGGVFVIFTYITPLLTDITGFRESTVTILLLLFGAGLTVGNIVGGKLSDWKLMPSLIGMLMMLMLVMAIFTFTSHNKIATVITIFVWGFFAFGTVPGFQMRVLDKAQSAPNLASALNIGAFNLGGAGGAWLGGVVLESPLGLKSLPWVAALVTLLGLMLTIWSHVVERNSMK
ncbi:MFS transporter [Paenibacillus selenitireducens]|uniref:MFS transporter n=1 Tax=Paenibacillus selenitireducens TaxID=1324314 RepID=A0A1T2XBX0_9BACL|nr:MFS transporter [Paenibacillus selenitireducens]OPA77397.1 MFS transporter [Paenibacillus selenitireducens]